MKIVNKKARAKALALNLMVELKPKPKNTGRVTAPEVFLHKVAIKASKDWFVAISTY